VGSTPFWLSPEATTSASELSGSVFSQPHFEFSVFPHWLPGLDVKLSRFALGRVGPSAQSLRDALWAPHLRSLRSLRRTMAHAKVLVLIQAGQPSD
jgi:hypothetical protein